MARTVLGQDTEGSAGAARLFSVKSAGQTRTHPSPTGLGPRVRRLRMCKVMDVLLSCTAGTSEPVGDGDEGRACHVALPIFEHWEREIQRLLYWEEGIALLHAEKAWGQEIEASRNGHHEPLTARMVYRWPTRTPHAPTTTPSPALSRSLVGRADIRRTRPQVWHRSPESDFAVSAEPRCVGLGFARGRASQRGQCAGTPHVPFQCLPEPQSHQQPSA